MCCDAHRKITKAEHQSSVCVWVMPQSKSPKCVGSPVNLSLSVVVRALIRLRPEQVISRIWLWHILSGVLDLMRRLWLLTIQEALKSLPTTTQVMPAERCNSRLKRHTGFRCMLVTKAYRSTTWSAGVCRAVSTSLLRSGAEATRRCCT